MIAIARAMSLQSSSNDIASGSHNDDVNMDNESSLGIPDLDNRIVNDVREKRIPKRNKSKAPNVEPSSPEASPTDNVVIGNIHEDTIWERDQDEEDENPPQSRKRARATEEAAYEAEERSTSSQEDDSQRERSFSRSLFTPNELPSRVQRQNASVIVPANISINAKFFTLKNALISPLDATTLLNQCLVPGFSSTVRNNYALIHKKAQYQIDNRVIARDEDWLV